MMQNGCLFLVGVFLLLVITLTTCTVLDSGESDCYSTPGAEPGSAQAERDIQRCLE